MACVGWMCSWWRDNVQIFGYTRSGWVVWKGVVVLVVVQVIVIIDLFVVCLSGEEMVKCVRCWAKNYDKGEFNV